MSNTKIYSVLKQLTQSCLTRSATPGYTPNSVIRFGLVSGNQSGDADSIISSITYCYLHYKQTEILPSTAISPVIYLPYLNFARSELHLRKDVLRVFQQHHITENLLIFSDDLDTVILEDQRFKDVILVDHNVPQGALAKFMDNNKDKLQISGIIDHHIDEGQFTKVAPRIIEKSGSSISLIYSYFKTLNNCVSQDSELLSFIINPVLLDTSNMQSRVEEFDKELFQDFQKLYQEKVKATKEEGNYVNSTITKSIYDELLKAKNDISGLSLTDLLNKDYKNFSSLKDRNYQFGISSIGVSLEYIISTYSLKDVKEEISLFIKSNGIEFLGLMTSFVKPGSKDDFHRQLGFFGIPVAILENTILPKIESTLALQEFEFNPEYIASSSVSKWEAYRGDDSGLILFEQGNLGFSRKQVAPLLRENVRGML